MGEEHDTERRTGHGEIAAQEQGADRDLNRLRRSQAVGIPAVVTRSWLSGQFRLLAVRAVADMHVVLAAGAGLRHELGRATSSATRRPASGSSSDWP